MGELLKFFQDKWLWIREKTGILLLFASPLVYLWAIIVTNFDSIIASLDAMNESLDSVATTASANSVLPAIATVWNLARYIGPVEICLYYAGMLLYLRLLCSLIRILKSWIPTIN